MSDIEVAIKEWAARVESSLPLNCPKCGCSLDQIRYGYERTEERIHLTEVTNQYDSFVAECPSCGHVLLREGVGGRRVH